MYVEAGEARQGHEEEGDVQDIEDVEQVLKACMERFYYTRCYSSLEFISALKVTIPYSWIDRYFRISLQFSISLAA